MGVRIDNLGHCIYLRFLCAQEAVRVKGRSNAARESVLFQSRSASLRELQALLLGARKLGNWGSGRPWLRA